MQKCQDHIVQEVKDEQTSVLLFPTKLSYTVLNVLSPESRACL